MAKKFYGIDFETYSDVDLPVRGLRAYIDSPNFTPLVVAVYNDADKLTFDLTDEYEMEGFKRFMRGSHYVTFFAHNAGFERAVMQSLGYTDLDIIDTACIARLHGYGGRLEAAAPQALGVEKLPDGKRLISLFSIPRPEEHISLSWDTSLPFNRPADWALFQRYCQLDAELSYRLGITAEYSDVERANQEITELMNQRGWAVDEVLLDNMTHRYKTNLSEILMDFQSSGFEGAAKLNFNSTVQLIKWCKDRGIQATSFNELSVTKMLARLEKRAETQPLTDGQLEVQHMLRVKQELGGSSLKKLAVIENQLFNGHVYDQYLHIGAGQTARTTGRGVQMQNIKRLPPEIAAVTEWPGYVRKHVSNAELAGNLRQLFTSRWDRGSLGVADFSSVENRGLAFLAGDTDKLEAFRKGVDMYKRLASEVDGTPYDEVTKERRQFGKVGELSCGYQAGGSAVKDFAEKMGTDLTIEQANQLVQDWRSANPAAVKLWNDLDDELRAVVNTRKNSSQTLVLQFATVHFNTTAAPASLTKQYPHITQSLYVRVGVGSHSFFRVFHGVHMRGNSIAYCKPKEAVSKSLWTRTYTHPKTKKQTPYTLYGGKLTGILVQSLCREIFFDRMRELEFALAETHSMLIGQFHDEVVVDIYPGEEDTVIPIIQHVMSSRPSWLGREFPLAADVQSAYRYIK